MKKQLHLIKSSSEINAISIVREMSRKDFSAVKVVLLQEGISIKPDWKAKTYLLKNEGKLLSPIPEGLEVINYDQLVDLMFEADSVVGW